MKTGTAVKVYSIMMGLLLLFALVMTGGNVKAADNEAMTIQIQPGDEKIEIYNDYYVLNGSTRQDWSGDYVLTGSNFNQQGDYSAFQVIVEDGYSSNGGARSITLSSLNILNTISSETCAFSLQGNADVRLLLEGVNQLQSGQMQAGIQASSKTGALTIEGSGSLYVQGGYTAAGIGGGFLQDGRNITINSGTIMAAGGSENSGVSSIEQNDAYVTVESWMLPDVGSSNKHTGCGAGIGGGDLGAGVNITINGGSVTANGAGGGSGIGGGSSGHGLFITINDGRVSASGGLYGAGIGGGFERDGENITINSGLVMAEGGDKAAGIGGGARGNGRYLTINGGTITAVGQYTADDIGGGTLTISSHNGPLVVTGGSINADLYKNDDPRPYSSTDQSGSSLLHYTLNLTDASGNAVSGASVESLKIGSCSGNAETDSSQYGIRGMQTNDAGQLSLYLDITSVPEDLNVTVVADGVTYTGTFSFSGINLTPAV